MSIEEINKEITFAEMVIGAIDNVKTPMLMYKEEKAVTKKALQEYIYKLESDVENLKEWPHKPCINYEDGCEEWAGCPCVYYKTKSEVKNGKNK